MISMNCIRTLQFHRLNRLLILNLLSLLNSALFLSREIRGEMLALTAKKAEAVVEVALPFFGS